MRIALIAVAGALGALARYAITRAVGETTFPWATLAINVVGAALLGAIAGALSNRFPPDVVVAVTTGFLGAFTTFSTFALETTAMARDGHPARAAIYVALSVALGLAASAGAFTATSNRSTA